MQWIYWLSGGYFMWLAIRGANDLGNPRRMVLAAFWAILGLLFLIGEQLPALWVGAAVVALALLAGVGLGKGTERVVSAQKQEADAQRFGHRLFAPALVIPLFTLLVALWLKDVEVAGWRLFAEQHSTVVGLGVACLLALGAACWLTRESPATGLESSRKLIDAIGWAALLPLLLATLGSVFAASGVGDSVSHLISAVIPQDNRLAVVLAYALGMAAFTMIMGNAFAAFPVMTAGIGLPLLVQQHGADAASLAAIGMLSGYCGTLMTPMAANFNIVPAALLELKDPHGVIRMQVGTALPLLLCNILLMYFIVFR
nr:DUF979 domain-containing protein [Pseudomarimonas arenosa]